MPAPRQASSPNSRVRSRLDPAKRQSLILDHAAEIIAREGVSALSMDRIGREAGVSKSLVYNYFPSLTDLLRQLLQRELRRMRRLQADAAENARTFEGLVRAVTRQSGRVLGALPRTLGPVRRDQHVTPGQQIQPTMRVIPGPKGIGHMRNRQSTSSEFRTMSPAIMPDVPHRETT